MEPDLKELRPGDTIPNSRVVLLFGGARRAIRQPDGWWYYRPEEEPWLDNRRDPNFPGSGFRSFRSTGRLAEILDRVPDEVLAMHHTEAP